MPKGTRGRTFTRHICQVCGVEFDVAAGRVNPKTCSQKCGNVLRANKLRELNKAQESRVEHTCKTCGKTFLVAKGGKAKYCSTKCMYARNNTTRNCECCGKEFRSPPSQMAVRTCSLECGYKIRNVAHKVDPVRCECKLCGKEFFGPPSVAAHRVYCSKECQEADPSTKVEKSRRTTAWYDVIGRVGIPSVSVSGKAYLRQSLAKENAKSNARRAAKLQATVAWADKDKIAAIYTEAQRLTELTGVVYHVDHIVPLVSSKVCGLHNEFNLQVLPGVENLKKHNRHWPDMW
jgi:predicted nucleic acid-binding Zn ribbon protein